MDIRWEKGSAGASDGSTQVPTQILDDKPDQPSQSRELGKKVSDKLRELFVVCDPSEALRQHFELAGAPYLLLRDLGGGAARAFLEAFARTTSLPVEELSVRRQGFGTVLATLTYVDCPARGDKVRIYLDDAQTESSEQIAISRVLTEWAGLHVLFGESLGPQTQLALTCLKDDLTHARRSILVPMLVLPQKREEPLTQAIEEFGQQTRVKMEVGPATTATSGLWALMVASWNRHAQANVGSRMPLLDASRLKGQSDVTAADVVTVTRRPKSPDAPLASPLLVVNQAAAPAMPKPQGEFDLYLQEIVARTDSTHGCLFMLADRSVVASTPHAPAADMAAQSHHLLAAVGRVGVGLEMGRMVRETHVTMGEMQLVVRPARVKAGSVLVLLLPRQNDPTAWRLAIDRYDAQWLAQRKAAASR